MQNKFKNIPHIYYLNSEEKWNLKEYTEKHLDKIGISNFTRISNLEFHPKDVENWRHLVYNKDSMTSEIESEVALSILHINTIKKWLETTREKYVIIMSDHVDYSYVEYFYEDWDWDYFMKNIPHDFDSMLLGFEDKLGVLPCFLHPIRDSHSTGMTMLTRKYAEKLVKFHYIDGKYNFFQKISNKFWKTSTGLVPLHYFMNQCGKSYAIPLFPRNTEFTEDKYFTKEEMTNNQKLYSSWWQQFKNYISTEQFHLYFSPEDFYLNIKQLNKGQLSIADNNINHNFLIY
jgi:hypothetical protein